MELGLDLYVSQNCRKRRGRYALFFLFFTVYGATLHFFCLKLISPFPAASTLRMNANFSAPFHSECTKLVDESAFFHSAWAVPDHNLPSFEAAILEDTFTATCDRANAKVPIPRTTHSTKWIASGRVSRACEKCRDQKAKCSGNRPVCNRCRDAGATCSYGDRKKEKMAKWVTFCRQCKTNLIEF